MLLTDIHDISTSMSNNEECEAIGYDFNNGSLEPKGLSHKRKLADLEKPPSKKLRWNEELDHLLSDSVKIYGHDWCSVANYVTTNSKNKVVVSNTQCKGRWFKSLVAKESNLKVSEWTDEEDKVLLEYVDSHKKSNGDIDWTQTASILMRSSAHCRDRYRCMKGSTGGRFKPEEDEIILRTISMWPKSRKGLWVELSKVLGRNQLRIRDRYHYYLSRMKNPFSSESLESDRVALSYPNFPTPFVNIPTLPLSSCLFPSNLSLKIDNIDLAIESIDDWSFLWNSPRLAFPASPMPTSAPSI